MDNNKKVTIVAVSAVIVIAIAIIVFLLTKNTNTVYTISFNTDGGNEVVSQQVEEGKKVTRPSDPSKEGYEFLGWYLNGAYFDFETEVKGDLKLDAKWKEIVVEDNKDDENDDNKEDEVTKYTVTFNSDGGSSVSKQTVEEGKKATEPKAPTKKGYTFKGWYLGSTKYNFSNKVTKNITLTAKWEKVEEQETPVTPEVKKYTVTFDANGGTSVAKQTVEEGKKAAEPKKPTRTGYTFLGWYLGDTKFDFSTAITKDIKLIAKWEKNDVIEVLIVKDEGSSTGQYIIYVTKNGSKVAGTVDITNSKGVTKTVDIPAKGLSRPEGSFSKVTNPKVK